MRCNWSTTAKNILHAISHWNPSAFESRNISLIALRRHGGLPTALLPSLASPFSTQRLPFMSTKSMSTWAATKPLPEESTEYVAPLSPAQLSRAAAQAVRLSFREGSVRNAFYIVNSARWSGADPNKFTTKFPGVRTPLTHFKPIEFNQPISARLSAHCLLHSLIRAGLTMKAAREADLMMRDGMQIRSATLLAVMKALTSNSLIPPPLSKHSRSSVEDSAKGPSHIPLAADSLVLRPGHISDQCTRYAIRLVIQARKYRQRRTKEMYKFLISACLLQGEIIIACLLFVLVIKDWQLRKSLSDRLGQKGSSEAEESPVSSPLNRQEKQRWMHLRREMIFPGRELLIPIIETIDTGLSPNQDGSRCSSFGTCLQALANLATALDRHQLPVSVLTPLIRSLYSCPDVNDKVWIEGNNDPKLVVARSYFHRVLLRFIEWLPVWQPTTHPPYDQRHCIPRLDMSTYNSLLHYALRHRLSSELANKILEHMTEHRDPPLRPDMVTHNIVLRAGTLLRSANVNKGVLESLYSGGSSGVNFLKQFSDLQSKELVQDEDQSFPPLQLTSRQTPVTEDFRLISDRFTEGAIDSYTVTSYIAHLTGTGRPHSVVDLLFYILPELSTAHPSCGTSHQKAVERAVALGPWFFTVVLHALRKAGKIGLAERVWFLAKQAEQASWVAAPRGETQLIRPWCLPIHAYTTMMQCYADQARKGSQNRSAGGVFAAPASLAKGWAHSIRGAHASNSQIYSSVAAREMAMLLLDSMQSVSRTANDFLMNSANGPKAKAPWNIKPPVPDARFFNAILKVFVRQPCSHSRNNPARCRHRLRRAFANYSRHGITSPQWDPSLRVLAEAMLRAGYPVPLGLRHVFVGRWNTGTYELSQRPELAHRPFCYPAPTVNFRSHGLMATKNRGLPVRKRLKPTHLRRQDSHKVYALTLYKTKTWS